MQKRKLTSESNLVCLRGKDDVSEFLPIINRVGKERGEVDVDINNRYSTSTSRLGTRYIITRCYSIIVHNSASQPHSHPVFDHATRTTLRHSPTMKMTKSRWDPFVSGSSTINSEEVRDGSMFQSFYQYES